VRPSQREEKMTIYITEEHLGPLSTPEHAEIVVELLCQRGYDVEYGTGRGEGAETAISDADWQACDIQAAEEIIPHVL